MSGNTPPESEDGGDIRNTEETDPRGTRGTRGDTSMGIGTGGGGGGRSEEEEKLWQSRTYPRRSQSEESESFDRFMGRAGEIFKNLYDVTKELKDDIKALVEKLEANRQEAHKEVEDQSRDIRRALEEQSKDMRKTLEPVADFRRDVAELFKITAGLEAKAKVQEEFRISTNSLITASKATLVAYGSLGGIIIGFLGWLANRIWK